MRKIFLSIISAILLISALTSCGRLPFHNHHTDNYGICLTCFEDVGHPLFESGGRLSSGEVFAKDGEKLYFRFKPNGDGQTLITVNLGSATMDDGDVTLYTKSGNLALTDLGVDGKSVKFRYDGSLDPNVTYYISFGIKTKGTVIVNSDCHLSDM